MLGLAMKWHGVALAVVGGVATPASAQLMKVEVETDLVPWWVASSTSPVETALIRASMSVWSRTSGVAMAGKRSQPPAAESRKEKSTGRLSLIGAAVGCT